MSLLQSTTLAHAWEDEWTLLEKVEIPMEFRDRIYFFFNRDGIRYRKSS
jgi:hypothetical protein